jgi:hypothetical protein
MTPALNKLFLHEDSALYNSVTKAVDNLGQLLSVPVLAHLCGTRG